MPVAEAEFRQPPADVALQVCQAGKWRLVCASYRGLQHVEQELPRQDAFAFACGHGVIDIAVADGLGSAALSDLGAQLACDRGVHLLSSARPRDKADFLTLGSTIQQDFFRYAAEQKVDPRELATTLQLLSIDDEGFQYGRVGDGGCVLLGTDGARWLGGLDSAPLGVTNLSDPAALSRLEYDFVPAKNVVGFLIFSDGIEDIFLEQGKKKPEQDNVRRVVELVQDKDLGQLVALFNTFLSSDFEKDLKDDKTIIAGALDARGRGQTILKPAPRSAPLPVPPPGPPAVGPGPFGLRRWLAKRAITVIALVVAALLCLGFAAGRLVSYLESRCFWFESRCAGTNPLPLPPARPTPSPSSSSNPPPSPPAPPSPPPSARVGPAAAEPAPRPSHGPAAEPGGQPSPANSEPPTAAPAGQASPTATERAKPPSR